MLEQTGYKELSDLHMVGLWVPLWLRIWLRLWLWNVCIYGNDVMSSGLTV